MERTWWIVRHPILGPVTFHIHGGAEGIIKSFLERFAYIGPYWSNQEAQQMIDHWSK